MTADTWASMERKLVAILRGITPEEVAEVVSGLIQTGFHAIEIPLNSPDPFKSIEMAARLVKDVDVGECLIGAGTVLTVEDASSVKAAGGNLVVSPNANPAVIAAAVEQGMICLPGVFTPTEAHAALAAGAHGLKFFPASLLGPEGIAAIKVILPQGTEICAVGGVEPQHFAAYSKAGVQGFGLGSCLYKPGMSVQDIMARAQAAIAAFDAL
jgi:2-dehydro-3-deoxyphosphogalactonate aldolase